MSLYERARHYRSHSLKPLNQPSLLTQRSKRTLSLPSKPIIPPLINVQRYHDNWENESDEEDQICETNEETIGKLLVLSSRHCFVFFSVFSGFPPSMGTNTPTSTLKGIKVNKEPPLRGASL